MDVNAPDLSASAGLYSQLASVLAGFAFAAVITLVAAQLASSSNASRTLESGSPLVAAFIALTISSLDFAILAAERFGTARAAILQTLAAMGLSVACILLLYSILVLVRGLEQDAAKTRVASKVMSDLIRDLLIVAISPVTILLMWNGARDHVNFKYGPTAGFGGLDWIALITLVSVFVVGVVFRHLFRRRSQFHLTLTKRIAYAGAILATSSILGCSLVITFIHGDTRVWDLVPAAAIVLVGAFALSITYSASRSAAG